MNVITNVWENAMRSNYIDLSGPEGNAYVLMGYAKNLARQLGFDGDRIVLEMQSGDYENLVTIFLENFGDYVEVDR